MGSTTKSMLQCNGAPEVVVGLLDENLAMYGFVRVVIDIDNTSSNN